VGPVETKPRNARFPDSKNQTLKRPTANNIDSRPQVARTITPASAERQIVEPNQAGKTIGQPRPFSPPLMAGPSNLPTSLPPVTPAPQRAGNTVITDASPVMDDKSLNVGGVDASGNGVKY
jgi:hypothetical protein